MKKTYPTDPADILEGAVELLESENVTWIQGGYHQINPYASNGFYEHGYCAVGALRQVAGLGDLQTYHGIKRKQAIQLENVKAAEHALIAAAMPEISRRLSFHIETWNDGAGRTEEEVIDAMKLAAKELRNQRPAACLIK